METPTALCPECGQEGTEVSRYSASGGYEKALYRCSNKVCQHSALQSPFVISYRDSEETVKLVKKRGRPRKFTEKLESLPQETSSVGKTVGNSEGGLHSRTVQEIPEIPVIPLVKRQPVNQPDTAETKKELLKEKKNGFSNRAGKDSHFELDEIGSEKHHVERVCLFIDGVGFYFALKRNNLSTRVNYYELAKALAGPDRRLIRTYYFNSAYDPVLLPEQHKNQQPFLDSLVRTPYLELHLGRIVPQKDGGVREKGSDVRLASELIYYAGVDTYDAAVVITENTDFSPVLSHVKELGKHVELCLFADSQPRELVHSADRVLPLNEVFKRFNTAIFP